MKLFRKASRLRLDGSPRRVVFACCCALFVAASVVSAQQPPAQRITTNFKDADITQIAEAVSMATGRTFIIDPRVRAQVTMLSTTPMTPDAFYEAFLSILQVHGFIAVPSGDVIKIVPDATARTMPGTDLPDRPPSAADEIVTQVIAIKNVSAAQLVPVLRPLIPQYGHLAAHPASNVLIISDRAANVNRIARIIRRIDQAGDSDVEVITLQNASAVEVVRIINSLYQQQAAEGGGGANPLRLAADERSNSVLVSGDPEQRLRIKTLIAHLDTPLESGGDTQVRYLRYADAEKVAALLKEQVTGIAQAAAPTGGQQAAPAQQQIDRNTTIIADPETNALVITAPPKVMKSLMSIVDKLDIRRMQVLIEAIIVEVQADKTAELGVNWAAWSEDDDERFPAGAFVSPVGGTSIVNLAQIAADPEAAAEAGVGIPTGTTLGIGRIAGTGVNFAAMLRALRGDANTNVLATPSAVTMDNQEAELKVAQEVPFITGQFTNTGAGGTLNPFQTIQREEVGTILKVTPQVSSWDSNAVLLKIELESSSLASSSQGAVDLITNKRSISTNVLIEDGGIIVLGGLISDESTQGEQRVPFLGRIPLLGLAFKTRNARATKTNLMVFIRPKILRDGTAAAIETNSKYNYIREEQIKARSRELLPLLPGVQKPLLPPAPPVPPPGSTESATPPGSEESTRKETQQDGAATRPADAPPQAAPATPPNENAEDARRDADGRDSPEGNQR